MSPLPTHFGSYEIIREIGRGGMGVVYLARDTKLDRDVAIKCLPDQVAQDEGRLQRFEREAKLLASLNHPNIATIHGLEEVDGKRYLILEYVEGKTLEERLRKGAIPVDEALPIATQIAQAIEAAHDKGIIHRDLKPANIKFTSEDQVKVLDFGLAKALSDEGSTASELAHSPTINAGNSPTLPGVVLGTAGYLSPEQARGKPVDKRTDIFSFGCVLYEMLTDLPPFPGETAAESIGATLHKDVDFDQLPPNIPIIVRHVLRRCLERDRNKRLRDIGDARLELEELAAGKGDSLETLAVAGTIPPSSQRTVFIGRSLVAILVVVTVVLAWLAFRPRTSLEPVSLNLSIIHRADEPTYTEVYLVGPVLALSPDGTRLVYIGSVDGISRLYVRHLSEADSRLIPGTEGAKAPFFSLDGSLIGFVAHGKLKIVAFEGSVPRVLCDAPFIRGACWIDPETILFSASTTSALELVSVSDGRVTALTQLDSDTGEVTHRFPELLPDGRHALFNLRREKARLGVGSVAIVDLQTGEHEVILESAAHARYVDGMIVYSQRDGSVRAIQFDPAARTVSGSPVTVLQGVRVQPLTGTSNFSVAGNGTLAYIPGESAWTVNTPVWRNRDGESTPAIPEARRFTTARLSPDGRYLAVGIAGPDPDIWRYDLSHDPPTRLRLTSDGASILPVWSPDSQWIVFASSRSGTIQLTRMRADGSAGPELLQPTQHYQFATSWSSDGTLLAYTERNPVTGDDVWILPLEGDRQPWPVAIGPSMEKMPSFSPDGVWIAYTSDESGDTEIYVRRTSGDGGHVPVSVGGGMKPVWRGDEIFYRRGDEMMAVSVTTDPEFSSGSPESLFTGLSTTGPPARVFDVDESGENFIVPRPERKLGDASFMEIRIITNWIEQVKRMMPSRG